MFGSDGIFAPENFTVAGSIVSSFPVDYNSRCAEAFKSRHGGRDEPFGLPTYIAAAVDAEAIMQACKNGTASRAEVRAKVTNIKLSKKESLLGFPVGFLKKNGRQQGPGDMGGRPTSGLQDRRRREVHPRRLEG